MTAISNLPNAYLTQSNTDTYNPYSGAVPIQQQTDHVIDMGTVRNLDTQQDVLWENIDLGDTEGLDQARGGIQKGLNWYKQAGKSKKKLAMYGGAAVVVALGAAAFALWSSGAFGA